jgi:hypothetical protein
MMQRKQDKPWWVYVLGCVLLLVIVIGANYAKHRYNVWVAKLGAQEAMEKRK